MRYFPFFFLISCPPHHRLLATVVAIEKQVRSRKPH